MLIWFWKMSWGTVTLSETLLLTIELQCWMWPCVIIGKWCNYRKCKVLTLFTHSAKYVLNQPVYYVCIQLPTSLFWLESQNLNRKYRCLSFLFILQIFNIYIVLSRTISWHPQQSMLHNAHRPVKYDCPLCFTVLVNRKLLFALVRMLQMVAPSGMATGKHDQFESFTCL